MRNPRIYTEQVLIPGATLTLDERASNYLARVLRCQSGMAITLFNGDSKEYAASVTAVDKRNVAVVINDASIVDRESPLKIHLGIAISKGDRMDLVMQKAVELGVSDITPLISERVEVRLQGERADKRIEHWRGIIISACEQCARNTLPKLNPIAPLNDWISRVEADKKFVLHHRSDTALGTSEKPNSVALLIGPEGGLSEAEIDAAQRQSFAPLRLGPRVLRTETAPLAALSILQFVFGDLNT